VSSTFRDIKFRGIKGTTKLNRVNVTCSKSDHLRGGPPFSEASLDKNIFRSFLEKEK